MKKGITISVHKNPNGANFLDDLENFLNVYIGKCWQWSASEMYRDGASINNLQVWDLKDYIPREKSVEEEIPY